MLPRYEVVRASLFFVSGNTHPSLPKPAWAVAAFVVSSAFPAGRLLRACQNGAMLIAVVMFTALMPGDTRAQEVVPVSGYLVVVPQTLEVGQRTLAVGFQVQPDDLEVRIEYSDHFTPAGQSCQAASAGATHSSVASISISLIACSAGDATVRLVVADTGVVIEEVDVTITKPADTAHTQTSIDRDALVTLYNAMDGDNWTVTWNWLSDKHISQWYGVTTDDDGRVIFLDLSENHFEWEYSARNQQSIEPANPEAPRQPVERECAARTRQSIEPAKPASRRQPVEREYTARTRNPLQSRMAVDLR